MMKRVVLLTVAIALAVASIALAQAKPNFSGTWVLDPSKSEMGQARVGANPAAARTVTLVLRQSASELTIEQKLGERTLVSVYKLDGTESVNKSPSGADIKSTTSWSGSTLMTRTSMTLSGPQGEMTSHTTDVRSLSANGQTMTVELTRQTAQGEVKQKLVYNKK
jgi:hypothetical protein